MFDTVTKKSQPGGKSPPQRHTSKDAGSFVGMGRTASAMPVSKASGFLTAIQPTLQRKEEVIDVDLVPTSPEESERLKKQGINLPTVSAGVWRIIGGVADNAGAPLIPAEKRMIEERFKKVTVSTGTALAVPMGAKFLLHDTSSSVGAAKIAEEAKLGRGPLGGGVSAWVPRDAAATITRPDFFETRRPSTTEFEKALETFAEAGDKSKTSAEKIKLWVQRRDALFREVWSLIDLSQQTIALQQGLSSQGLTGEEIEEEIKGNKKKGKGKKTGAEAQLQSGSSEKIMTAAAWGIEEICKKVSGGGAKGIAVSSKEADLEKACAKLSTYFTERNARVGSTVTVEIVQPGVRSKAEKAKAEGRDIKDVKINENTCDPNNPDIIKPQNPPYSDIQYDNIVNVYLRAAYIAGTFPEIMTHYAVDAFIGGHCDPRCFDLMKLYNLIAAALGHGKGSTYGFKPSYGMKSGTNNVWWDDKICGGSSP